MKHRLMTVVLLVSTALPLAAQEHGGGEGGLSPFAGNVGNAIWTLAIFLVVVIVLGKFAWGPLLAMLREREEFIHKSLADARRDREEAEARLKEYSEKIQAAKREADAILTRSREDAERMREDIKQKARGEAETLVRSAEQRIQLETAKALEQIRHEAVDLSVTIASKLIKRNISKEDNDRLIDEALKELEKPRKLAH